MSPGHWGTRDGRQINQHRDLTLQSDGTEWQFPVICWTKCPSAVLFLRCPWEPQRACRQNYMQANDVNPIQLQRRLQCFSFPDAIQCSTLSTSDTLPSLCPGSLAQATPGSGTINHLVFQCSRIRMRPKFVESAAWGAVWRVPGSAQIHDPLFSKLWLFIPLNSKCHHATIHRACAPHTVNMIPHNCVPFRRCHLNWDTCAPLPPLPWMSRPRRPQSFCGSWPSTKGNGSASN